MPCDYAVVVCINRNGSLQKIFHSTLTELQEVGPWIELHDAFTGHVRQRHGNAGCGKTRTVSARSVRALWTLPLESTCLELQFSNFSSVYVLWTNLNVAWAHSGLKTAKAETSTALCHTALRAQHANWIDLFFYHASSRVRRNAECGLFLRMSTFRGLCASHDRELCRSGWADRDAVFTGWGWGTLAWARRSTR